MSKSETASTTAQILPFSLAAKRLRIPADLAKRLEAAYRERYQREHPSSTEPNPAATAGVHASLLTVLLWQERQMTDDIDAFCERHARQGLPIRIVQPQTEPDEMAVAWLELAPSSEAVSHTL